MKHFQQNLNGDDYALAESEELTGEYGDVTVTPKQYDGFALNSDKSQLSGELYQNGTEYALYYDRVLQSVTYSSDYHCADTVLRCNVAYCANE